MVKEINCMLEYIMKFAIDQCLFNYLATYAAESCEECYNCGRSGMAGQIQLRRLFRVNITSN